jgi:hypothetical protein
VCFPPCPILVERLGVVTILATTDFLRAQKADSEDVSGSDADARSSGSRSADIYEVSYEAC